MRVSDVVFFWPVCTVMLIFIFLLFTCEIALNSVSSDRRGYWLRHVLRFCDWLA